MRSLWNSVAAVALWPCAAVVQASQKAFSVSDDVFAFPKYDISMSHGFILETEAIDRVKQSHAASQSSDGDSHEYAYEQAYMHGQPYFCSIPKVQPIQNATEDSLSAEEKKNELIRAADRGWELLKDLEGKQCLFYSTGWWSYTFCYNSHVKQFHSLPAGTGNAGVWPPQEDPGSPSYVLGRHDAKRVKQSNTQPKQTTETTELQRKAETSYLVQRMQGGTPCDLTGEDRSIEIQFHCNPQSTDRIGWIKEIATCAYLMVVYTPRLCNDVAFQLPKDTQAQSILCRPILREEEATSIDDVGSLFQSEDSKDQHVMVGNVEIGAMNLIGKDGQKIEKGRVVMTAEEKAITVMMQKDGQIQGLSRPELKKLNLSPETLEKFRKELQEIAGKKDWKIERLDGNEQVQLRGVVSEDKADVASEDTDETEEGSEEEYGTES